MSFWHSIPYIDDNVIINKIFDAKNIYKKTKL